VTILLKNQARTEIARSFYRDIYNENDFCYFYVGRTNEWDDEESPEDPIDSVSYENAARRNLIFVKRIQPADIVLVTRRINWVVNTVYDHYDNNYGELLNPADPTEGVVTSDTGAELLMDSNFYVMTDEYNVYKCLDNNFGAQSTIKPTGTDTIPIQTEDGYIWKFLFRVESADQIKFLTPEFIPVRKMSGVGVPFFDVNGKIDSITVTAQGSSYETAPVVIINGDGQGASATAVLGTGPNAGKVVNITLDEEGSGYTFAYVTFTGGGGSGAEASLTLGGIESSAPQEDVENAAVKGTVDRIEVVNGGIDYSANDVLITIDGDGSGAEATAIVSDAGVITEIIVTNQGSNYTFADITISNILGVGTNATARATISPYYGHGGNAQRELYATSVCISVNLTNDTSDYFLNNDFRQLGIIKNLSVFGEEETFFQEETGTACYVINVNNPSAYNSDDDITTDDGGKFIVVQVVGNLVYLLPVIPIITSVSKLTNNTNPAGELSINSVIEPEIDTKTGSLLYIDNRTYILRQEDQVEKVRAILKF